MLTRRLIAPVALLALLTLPSAAGATTFCVPTFHAACPNDGTNVVAASLDAAMTTNASDGVKDTVIIPAGVLTDPDTFTPSGTDDLEIAGAGRDATILTSSANTNSYVMNLSAGSRTVTLHDLEIRVPASFPDGLGAGVQASGATFDRVDLESRNPGASTALTAPSGSTFRHGEIRGAAGGSFGAAIKPAGANVSTLLVEDTTVRAAQTGVWADNAKVTVAVRRTRFAGTIAYGALADKGGQVTLENVEMTPAAGHALTASTNVASSSSITADHLTVAGAAGNVSAAVEADVTNVAGAGNATVTLRNSIVRGYTTTTRRNAPVSGTIGNANLTLAYSDIAVSGIDTGDGATTQSHLIAADPLFASATDLRLLAGSPAIDAADPADTVATDLDGAARPVDGDGDGVARADLGAYERAAAAPPSDPGTSTPTPVPADPAPAPSPAPAPAPAGDTTPPVLTKLGMVRTITRRRGGALRFTLTEPAKVELRFIRKVRGRTRKVTMTVRGKAGVNRVTIRRGRLAAARWRLEAVATDAAGNRGAVVAHRVQVRR